MCNEICAIQSSGKTLKRKKENNQIPTVVDWRAIAQKKRAAQAELIPSEVRVKNIPDGLVNAVEYVQSCGLLSDEELQLTRITDARVLLDKVVSGALTSAKIASAFIKRTAILQQLTGCCTEIFFDRALERAQILDRHLAETGKPIGPLHGLPVSVKDGFDVGMRSACANSTIEC